MSVMTRLQACAWLIVSFFVIATTFAADGTARPNVILIMADDFGFELIGANGGTSYKTPQLDRLAQTGMRFTQCYVQPLCTPTRVQLMTGIYNVRNYIEFGTLAKDATTFGKLFQKAGYATCITGKWQLGRELSLPQHFGFDEHCLWQHTRRPERYKNPGLEINGREMDYSQGEYGPDIVNDFALDFVSRKKDQPFFLYYPLMLTHDPYSPTPDSRDYDERGAKSGAKQAAKKNGRGAENSIKQRHFADMVEYTDKLIGKLLARLEELHLRERTLILFLGDNGTGAGTRSMRGDQVVIGGKGKTVETGMHVPLIANWPQTIPSGKVCHDLIDSTDFLPTICAAASVEVPSQLKIDGRSFWPQLRGEVGSPREWLYCWYSRDGEQTTPHEFARTTKYKLYRDGRFFDVQAEDMDRNPLREADRKTNPEAVNAHAKLQEVLGQFEQARPQSLKTKMKLD